MDEKHATELVTQIQTDNGNSVSVEAAAHLMLAENALLADIRKRYRDDEALVWQLRPFQKGSFEIVLELAAMAAPLLADSPVLLAVFKALKEFIDIKLALAGRTYEITGNNVIVVTGGENITVSPTGIVLLDPKSAGGRAAERAFEVMAQDETIRGVSFRRQADDAFAEVKRSEFSRFRIPQVEEKVRTTEKRVVVSIRQPAFDEGLVWRLVLGDHKISVEMEDEIFLAQAIAGEPFSHRDKLDVTLHVRQEYDPSLEDWIDSTTGHVVTKVWEHIKPDEQLALGDADSDHVSA